MPMCLRYYACMHLAESLAYLSFIVHMLQILQNNSKILNSDVINGFGKTAYLSMCFLTFLSQLIRFKNVGGCDCHAISLVKQHF